ncbi:hypothetical protein GGS23DRAFT_607308 [Durotheca rogersii]|uniref:uncharacterized protein n=1 Tax=Durotheca rogersii TaxID=419775 RepID=UPI00221F7F44|nr:uncharacterized protein GGS23DRAFT_607308 [Durotheca rogersii]KAI5859889.1 hypothetical protein GGS23DRAFT_607308 [Durotheca rogersii]
MTTATPPAQAQILAMPEGLNPDTLDTLTELAILLNRLRIPTSASTTTGATPAATTATAAPTPSQSQSQSQPHPAASSLHRPASQSSQAQTHNGATTTTHTGELSLKEIGPAADVLKHRFQRARVLVRALPDTSRGTAEQRAEIAALEDRLRRQRRVLTALGEMGARFAAAGGEDVANDEDEDDGERMDLE